MSKDSEVYRGVDVSKESVVSAEGRVLSRKQRVPRTAAAIQAAVRRCRPNALAVLERSGAAPALTNEVLLPRRLSQRTKIGHFDHNNLCNCCLSCLDVVLQFPVGQTPRAHRRAGATYGWGRSGPRGIVIGVNCRLPSQSLGRIIEESSERLGPPAVFVSLGSGFTNMIRPGVRL